MMMNLKVLKFDGRGLVQPEHKTEIVWPDIIPSINEIYINQVDKGFSFQKLFVFDTLTTLEVIDSWDDPCLDYETFENFLLMQKNLKVLHMRDLRSLFQTDKLTNNIKFSLEKLSLDGVYWSDNDRAMKFLKTQINLKEVKLAFLILEQIALHEEMIWYDEVLIHLFGKNLQLKTVKLSTCATYAYKIRDLSFLEGIVNSSVENLELDLDELQIGTVFIAAFTKLFPNVKNFSYTVRTEDCNGLDLIHNWKSLESINCVAIDINHCWKTLIHVKNLQLVPSDVLIKIASENLNC